MKNDQTQFDQGLDALNNNQIYAAENHFKLVANDSKFFLDAQFGLMLAYYYLGKNAELIKSALNVPTDEAIHPKVIPHLLNALRHTGNSNLISNFSRTLNQTQGDINILYMVSLCFKQVGQMDVALQYQKAMGENQTISAFLNIMDGLADKFPNKQAQFYKDALKQLSNMKNEEQWLNYQLFRYAPDALNNDTIDVIPTQPITARKIPYNPINSPHSRQILNKQDYNLAKAPPLNPDELSKSLIAFKEKVQEALKLPRLKAQLDFLKMVTDKYKTSDTSPIQILSTGRAGTTSLYDLLSKSTEYMPFHSFIWQSTPRDRIELFTRLRANIFDQNYVNRITLHYIKIRITEFLYAARVGRAPVIVSHWDCPFSIINAAIFENLKILYLDRNIHSTANSFINKLQWQYAQLMDVEFSIDEETSCFAYAVDEDGNLAQQVGWYIYATRILATALKAIVGDENFLEISADKLFYQDEEAMGSLGHFLGARSISIDDISQQFSSPTNQKDENTQAETSWGQQAVSEAAEHYNNLSKA